MKINDSWSIRCLFLKYCFKGVLGVGGGSGVCVNVCGCLEKVNLWDM